MGTVTSDGVDLTYGNYSRGGRDKFWVLRSDWRGCAESAPAGGDFGGKGLLTDAVAVPERPDLVLDIVRSLSRGGVAGGGQA